MPRNPIYYMGIDNLHETEFEKIWKLQPPIPNANANANTANQNQTSNYGVIIL